MTSTASAAVRAASSSRVVSSMVAPAGWRRGRFTLRARSAWSTRVIWPSGHHRDNRFAGVLGAPGAVGVDAIGAEGVVGLRRRALRRGEGGVHFAGEHTSTYAQGYLEVASKSGDRVTREALAVTHGPRRLDDRLACHRGTSRSSLHHHEKGVVR